MPQKSRVLAALERDEGFVLLGLPRIHELIHVKSSQGKSLASFGFEFRAMQVPFFSSDADADRQWPLIAISGFFLSAIDRESLVKIDINGIICCKTSSSISSPSSQRLMR